MQTSAPGIEFGLDTFGDIPETGSTVIPMVQGMLTHAEAAA